jgi:hypothetical protein
MFLEVKRVRPTISPPSVSQLSRQCGILNISKPCRPPRPVTGIALLLAYSQLSDWRLLKKGSASGTREERRIAGVGEGVLKGRGVKTEAKLEEK